MATKTADTTSKSKVDNGKAGKIAVGALVALVAGASGYGSYDHQVALAVANGWHGFAADVFPVMPDGMMVVGGLALLLPRVTRNTRAWARLMTLTGLAITMYANVITGIPYGTDGMILASVPAVALFLSSEALFRIVRDLNRKTGQKPAPGMAAQLVAWNAKRKRRAADKARRAARNAATAPGARHGYRTTREAATA